MKNLAKRIVIGVMGVAFGFAIATAVPTDTYALSDVEIAAFQAQADAYAKVKALAAEQEAARQELYKSNLAAFNASQDAVKAEAAKQEAARQATYQSNLASFNASQAAVKAQAAAAEAARQATYQSNLASFNASQAAVKSAAAANQAQRDALYQELKSKLIAAGIYCN